MKFIQFPHGKVFRVDNNGWVTGCVQVPSYEDHDVHDTLEAKLDAIAEAATGSSCGLTNFSYQYRGNDWVSFSGTAEELPAEEAEFEDAGFKVLEIGSTELRSALQAQYGLLDVEVDHALANLDADYGAECAVDILGSPRQLCSPAYPQACDYVRVVVAGLEVAYWTSDEWQDDPSVVMGALIGAVKGFTTEA